MTSAEIDQAMRERCAGACKDVLSVGEVVAHGM